jgi:hypothetical protein
MARGGDEQKALANESRRVRSALDDLADLAGGKRRRAAAPPAPHGLVAESFPLPPQAQLPQAHLPPTAPAPAGDDWFADDDGLAFTASSSGEVDFNSAPDAAVDTLGIRAASTQDTPAGGIVFPEPAAPQSEAINDVLDGFEW